jgi:outer membrane protein OmpA-like peptidoglycan-associated protein
MRHSRISNLPAVAISLVFFVLIVAPSAHGQAQAAWTVTMRAMQNPLALGQCTPIEVTVTDASGRAPVRPDGRQVDWQDFELSFSAPTPDAFAWSDETRHRFLCARAPTSASALVAAYYPARHLAATQIVPGMTAQQTVEVALLGAAQQAPNGPQQGQSSTMPPDQATAAAAAVGAAPQAGGAGAAPGYGQAAAGAAASAAGSTAGYAQAPAGGTAGGAGAAAGYGQPPAGAAASAAGTGQAAAGAAGAAPAQQAPAAAAGGAPALTPAVAAAPVQVTIPEKKGGFFKKLGQHLKEKASEATNQTAANLTASATQVVDATAQSGSNLVSGAAAQVTSVAQSKVGSVTTALVPSALVGGANADNLSVAVASGYAELRMMRFIGNTEVLDATGRDLVRRLAVVLKTTPGNFVIQAHVDLLPSPADPGASQVLSERRAAAVKAALIAAGVEAPRLTALGYGTSDPKPEPPPEGGPPSNARIVIGKTQ